MDTMNYHIEIAGQYIRVGFTRGTVLTVSLFREVLTAERGKKEHKVLNDIWDTRGCKVDSAVNSESIALIVEFIKELHAPGLYHKKSAIIVENELEYGISRIYQALTEYLPFETEIFYSEEEAKEWLFA